MRELDISSSLEAAALFAPYAPARRASFMRLIAVMFLSRLRYVFAAPAARAMRCCRAVDAADAICFFLLSRDAQPSFLLMRRAMSLLIF